MSELSNAIIERLAKREAERVLPFLQGEERILAPAGDEELGVFVAGCRPWTPLVTAAEPLVRIWLHNELVEISANAALNKSMGGSVFVLSRIGEKFLARLRGHENKFGAQHRVLVKSETASEEAPEFNANESPLSWLRLHKDRGGNPYIGSAEFNAGERLRADFTLAMLTPKSTASWPLERVDCSRRAGFSPVFESERALAARIRFWEALDSIGQEFASVLIAICCHLEGIEPLESRLGWPKRSGKAVLKLALRALARHYGLMQRESRAQIRARSLGTLPAE